MAIVAIALAVWALLRGSNAAPTYSDAQRADAKAKVCAVFKTVRDGVSINTHLQAPGGDADVVGRLGVAANARISLYDGGQYLLARLDPATPTELADTVREFANGLMDIGAASTAAIPDSDPEQAKRLNAADAAGNKIGKLCA